MYHLKKIIFLVSAMAASVSMSQEFYRSSGIQLFNQGQYATAVDSMLAYAEKYVSQSGIAHYYAGACYYHLGFAAENRSMAQNDFRQSADHFNRAGKGADLVTLYPDMKHDAEYGEAWALYRLAETQEESSEDLVNAINRFVQMTSEPSDSLMLIAQYMAGELYLMKAVSNQLQIHLIENNARKQQLCESVLEALQSAHMHFKQSMESPWASGSLRSCAAIRKTDVLYQWGKLYAEMPIELFSSVNDANKKGNPVETAISLFENADYPSLQNSMDAAFRDKGVPVILYSDAMRRLQLYNLTGDALALQALNQSLDRLTSSFFKEDKIFMQGFRDMRGNMEEDPFMQLADETVSFFTKVALNLPESWYWMGWMQYISNFLGSEHYFMRYLRETESIRKDQRIRFLREDAQYRVFMIRFDHSAGDPSMLSTLKTELERYRPEFASIRAESDLLLDLVRVATATGDQIYGSILGEGRVEERLERAILLIHSMMIRAASVTGKERVPYLEYLNRLFTITESRRSQETQFYKGMSRYLDAEIQETEEGKRREYLEAASILQNATGEYQYEGLYHQAKCYFSAAKHNVTQMNRDLETAKPLFIRLINEARSVRSVYYLGEILRIQGQDQAAARCYRAVMAKTRMAPKGEFWYNNASAGLKNCREVGDSTLVRGVQIDDVVFPENFLRVGGESVSTDEISGYSYLKNKKRETALEIWQEFGFPKQQIAPSLFENRFSRIFSPNFSFVTAGLSEKVGAVMSGLLLSVLYDENTPSDFIVTLDGKSLNADTRGNYTRKSIALNTLSLLQIEGPEIYTYKENIRFLQPGAESRVVTLIPQLKWSKRTESPLSTDSYIQLEKRHDKKIIGKESPSIGEDSELYRDFQNNMQLRDYAFFKPLNVFLAVQGDQTDLLQYRNDPVLSGAGVFGLHYPGMSSMMKSPEGIAIQANGTFYITDFSGHQVFIFSPDGTMITPLGKFGENKPADVGKMVQFIFPTTVAVSEDARGITVNGKTAWRDPILFVADRRGIHLFSKNGIYWDTFIPEGFKPGSIDVIDVTGYGAGAILTVVQKLSGKTLTYQAQLKN